MNKAIFDVLLDDPNYKLLIDPTTVGAITTTYIGKAVYNPTGSPLTSVAVRQIIKLVETLVGVDVKEERFVPLDANGFVSTHPEFIWDNRATLTYA